MGIITSPQAIRTGRLEPRSRRAEGPVVAGSRVLQTERNRNPRPRLEPPDSQLRKCKIGWSSLETPVY